MAKSLRRGRVGWVVGALVFLYGLPGILDDGSVWWGLAGRNSTLAPYAVTAAGVLVMVATAVVVFSPRAAELPKPGPRLVAIGATEQWRNARNSRDRAEDLQVLYERIRNDRSGGGEKASAVNAEIVMEAREDESDRSVGSGIEGNWLDLSAGKPPPGAPPIKRLTLKPSREHGIEIAGKFVWGNDAWIAGEDDPPSLKPGTYRIRASVQDEHGTLGIWEWRVTNPGPGKQLVLEPRNGVPPFMPRTQLALPPRPYGALAGATSASAASTGGVQEGDHASEPQKPADQRHAELLIAAKQPTADPVFRKVRETAMKLLEESEPLEKEMWATRLRMKKANPLFGEFLPSEFFDRALAWHRQVVELAESNLPDKEAGDVYRYHSTTGLGGAKVVSKMIESNRETLRLIARRFSS